MMDSWMPSGTPSPVPGPSGINTRNLQQQQQPSGGTLLTATSSSCGSDSTTPPQPGKFFLRLTSYKKKRPFLLLHQWQSKQYCVWGHNNTIEY